MRFYLLGVLRFEQDADFIEENLRAAYDSELANKWGNLVSRVLMLGKSVDWSPKSPESIETKFDSLHEDAFNKIQRINIEINELKKAKKYKLGFGVRMHTIRNPKCVRPYWFSS